MLHLASIETLEENWIIKCVSHSMVFNANNTPIKMYLCAEIVWERCAFLRCKLRRKYWPLWSMAHARGRCEVYRMSELHCLLNFKWNNGEGFPFWNNYFIFFVQQLDRQCFLFLQRHFVCRIFFSSFYNLNEFLLECMHESFVSTSVEKYFVMCCILIRFSTKINCPLNLRPSPLFTFSWKFKRFSI